MPARSNIARQIHRAVWPCPWLQGRREPKPEEQTPALSATVISVHQVQLPPRAGSSWGRRNGVRVPTIAWPSRSPSCTFQDSVSSTTRRTTTQQHQHQPKHTLRLPSKAEISSPPRLGQSGPQNRPLSTSGGHRTASSQRQCRACTHTGTSRAPGPAPPACNPPNGGRAIALSRAHFPVAAFFSR